MKDIVILVADNTMGSVLKAGLFFRTKSLKIRAIDFEIFVHPGRDGGTRSDGVDLLSLKRNLYQHALLVLDHEGSGSTRSAYDLEKELDTRLAEQWQQNGKSIAIEPELDIWMWGNDNLLEATMEWPHNGHIRDWLVQNGFPLNGNGKPLRPKEALQAVFRECKLPRSSANYEKISKRIGFDSCKDASFLRLKNQLQSWFGTPGNQ